MQGSFEPFEVWYFHYDRELIKVKENFLKGGICVEVYPMEGLTNPSI